MVSQRMMDGQSLVQCVWGGEGGKVGMNEEKRWGKPLKEKLNLYQIEATVNQQILRVL